MPARSKRPRRQNRQNKLPFLFSREAVLVILLRSRRSSQFSANANRGNPPDFAPPQLGIARREICGGGLNSRRDSRAPRDSKKFHFDSRRNIPVLQKEMTMSHNSKNNRVQS